MDEQLELVLKGGEFKKLIGDRLADVRKKYKLKKIDVEVLFFLSRCGEENTPTEIARRLQRNRGHISQAIDELIQMQYIRAIPDKIDRRCTHYLLCDSANEVIQEIAGVRGEVHRQIFSGLTEEEIRIYEDLTAKIFKNMENMLAG